MANADEAAIREMIEAMSAAWRRGDAKAYGGRFGADATFTNVFGDFYVGRQDFDRRHEEVFAGIFKGSTLSMQISKLRFLRRDARRSLVISLANRDHKQAQDAVIAQAIEIVARLPVAQVVVSEIDDGPFLVRRVRLI